MTGSKSVTNDSTGNNPPKGTAPTDNSTKDSNNAGPRKETVSTDGGWDNDDWDDAS